MLSGSQVRTLAYAREIARNREQQQQCLLVSWKAHCTSQKLALAVIPHYNIFFMGIICQYIIKRFEIVSVPGVCGSGINSFVNVDVRFILFEYTRAVRGKKKSRSLGKLYWKIMLLLGNALKLFRVCVTVVYIQKAVHCCLIMLILLNMPVIII